MRSRLYSKGSHRVTSKHTRRPSGSPRRWSGPQAVRVADCRRLPADRIVGAMATLPVEHPDQGFAPRARRSSAGPRLLAVFQLVFWSLLAAIFFLLVRPHHPFPDILLRQTAAAAAIGLACSAVLERLQALLHVRSPRFAAFVSIPLGSVLLGFAWYALAAWAGDVLDPFVFTPVRVPGGELFAPAQIAAFAAVLLLWSLLCLALVYWRDQRAQRERVQRAEALAQQAQLRMLRYQLNPHFLFNALNSIGALAGEAPHRVQRMVGELSGLPAVLAARSGAARGVARRRDARRGALPRGGEGALRGRPRSAHRARSGRGQTAAAGLPRIAARGERDQARSAHERACRCASRSPLESSKVRLSV